MTLISIKKTAVVEAAPTGTVSLYVDSADSHLKQVDEAGAIIDLTDGSAISSPNMAQLINITLETLVVDVVNEGLINPKATYRITDAAQGVIRVFGKSATELTATAMLEGTDDGTGSITAGQWGNYDLDGDVFTPSATSGTWTPVASSVPVDGVVTFYNGYYQRIGNIVSCGIRFNEITFPAGGALNFSVSLPINTTFANTNQIAASSIRNLELNEEWYLSQSASNKMDIQLTNGSGTASTIIGFQINFTYPVI